MVQNEDPILRITVTPADSLADLLPRIREHRGRPVFLTIPAQSPLFLTASEYRALRETVRSHGVNFTLISDDAHRRDFANLFNLVSVSEPPEGWPAADSTPGTSAAIQSESADPALGPPRSRRPLGARIAGELPSGDAQSGPMPSATWSSSWPTQRPAAGTTVGGWAPRIDEPIPDDSVPPVAVTTAAPEFPLVVVPAEEPKAEVKTRRRRWPWVTLIVVLLVAGLAAAGLFVPSATVTIAGARTPITTTVVFRVTAPGSVNSGTSDAAFTITGTKQQTSVTVSATVPATGQQTAPDQPARGEIDFANPTDQPVTIAAGTQIPSDQGLAYTLDADVTVPAAAGGASGTVSGAVTAIQGGAAGNLGQGVLSGRLDSGVYFNNRNAALSGGTDITLPVVTDADIANASAQLESLLPQQAAAALSSATGSPVAVVPGSVTPISPLNPAPNVPSGTQAAQVTVSATTTATMVTYNPADAQSQIQDAALSLATTAAPGNYDQGSFAIGNPEPVVGDTTASLVQVPVKVDQLLSIDKAQIDQLRDDIATKSVDEAGEEISGIAGVQSYEITIEPDWWPGDRLPVYSKRIDVVVK